MATAEDIERNQINLQVYRLEQLHAANAHTTPAILACTEQVLALAYIARELSKRS
jgi:hypothetical protein